MLFFFQLSRATYDRYLTFQCEGDVMYLTFEFLCWFFGKIPKSHIANHPSHVGMDEGYWNSQGISMNFKFSKSRYFETLRDRDLQNVLTAWTNAIEQSSYELPMNHFASRMILTSIDGQSAIFLRFYKNGEISISDIVDNIANPDEPHYMPPMFYSVSLDIATLPIGPLVQQRRYKDFPTEQITADETWHYQAIVDQNPGPKEFNPAILTRNTGIMFPLKTKNPKKRLRKLTCSPYGPFKESTDVILPLDTYSPELPFDERIWKDYFFVSKDQAGHNLDRGMFILWDMKQSIISTDANKFNGLFTSEDLQPHQLIGQYLGKLYEIPYDINHDFWNERGRRLPFDRDEQSYMVSSKPSEEDSHSKMVTIVSLPKSKESNAVSKSNGNPINPNCYFNGNRLYAGNRGVNFGEELFWDYGNLYDWKEYEKVEPLKPIYQNDAEMSYRMRRQTERDIEEEYSHAHDPDTVLMQDIKLGKFRPRTDEEEPMNPLVF
jgi:hypothetical protein